MEPAPDSVDGRPGRYATVAGNLRVKGFHVAPGGAGDGGARAVRFRSATTPTRPPATPPCGPNWSSTSRA